MYRFFNEKICSTFFKKPSNLWMFVVLKTPRYSLVTKFCSIQSLARLVQVRAGVPVFYPYRALFFLRTASTLIYGILHNASTFGPAQLLFARS